MKLYESYETFPIKLGNVSSLCYFFKPAAKKGPFNVMVDNI